MEDHVHRADVIRRYLLKRLLIMSPKHVAIQNGT